MPSLGTDAKCQVKVPFAFTAGNGSAESHLDGFKNDTMQPQDEPFGEPKIEKKATRRV